MSERRLAYMRAALEQAGQSPEEAHRRVLAAYGGYLGLAGPARVGVVPELPRDLVDTAMSELGLTG